jgi:hypothetical protein
MQVVCGLQLDGLPDFRGLIVSPGSLAFWLRG